MGLYDFTFYDLIQRNASSFANHPAWFEVRDQRSLNFSDYKRQVDQLACGLQAKGIQKGDRIGVIGKNCLEFFVLYGAASALGAIVLPINWRLSPEEVAFNLNDCTPVMVFASTEYQDLISTIADKLPSVKSFIGLNPDEGQFENIKSLMANSGTFDPAQVASDDGFVIIHTAAVEGRPRGALVSHANVLCASMHFMCYLTMSSDDVHLNLLPMFHVGGLFMAIQAFHSGALNVNMEKFDADTAVKLIHDKKVSVMFDFSPILGSIIESHQKSGTSIGTLQKVVGLESPETIETYQKITGGTFFCMYGQTETSCLATFGKYNDCPGSAGKPILMGRVQVVDDHDNPLEPGKVGEIVLTGPMVFKGYWGLDQDNVYTFREGMHHTGDMGRFDENGFLWYAGRKPEKELIKPGGENVYPAEVEKVILQHPSVSSVVVFGVPHPKWGEGIKAVCTLKENADLAPEELIRFVGERIASYKKPQYVEFVPELPKLENGEPDRMQIKTLYGGPQK